MRLVKMIWVLMIVSACFVPGLSFSAPSSDGSVYSQDFQAVEPGEIPEEWERHVQTVNDRATGHVEVRSLDRFLTKAFLIADGQAHIAAWSVSDEVMPADNQWAVQFDLLLDGRLLYSRRVMDVEDAGAVFGLKEGARLRGDFLPLISLDGNWRDGEKITLFGLGEVLEEDLDVKRWHRIVIRRDGTTWRFYVNNDLKATVKGIDTDLRGYAFASFKNWQHTARDVYINDFKIGRFVE